MKLIVGLDYELYFGAAPGSVEKCLIEPTDYLLSETAGTGFRLTLFVDAGCLLALKRSADGAPTFDRIAKHLQDVVGAGHDVQLHIHPHWEDSQFVDGQFRLDTSRYRLHDFAADEQMRIVSEYKQILEQITACDVFAYRAGGWCLQPFDGIVDALAANDIRVDSTVFSGGISTDSGREFDFRNAPEDAGLWQFERDPNTPAAGGAFTEVPITPVRSTPLFYVKGEASKRFDRNAHRNFGDGSYLSHDFGYYWERLSRRSWMPLSVDGTKASMLERAYTQAQVKNLDLLNVMGHPKALSRYSVSKLLAFLQHRTPDCHTFGSYLHSRRARAA